MRVRCRAVSLLAVWLVIFFVWFYVLLEGWPVRRTRVPCGPTQNHVFLLRIPKTGTSTTTFIFWRFAINWDLTVLLPKPNIETTLENIGPKNFELSPSPFDVIANQLIYNPKNFRHYFPPDVTYVALLREPFAHLTSVLNYIGHDYFKKMPKGDLTKLYLQDAHRYEAQFHHSVSLTDNPFARYFGLPKNRFHGVDSVQSFISQIDTDFKVVLILEHFDESLVMMKRILCWNFRDIIYTVENRNSDKPSTNKSDVSLLSKHRLWARVDYEIYDHFKRKLNLYVKNGGEDFNTEVLEFKALLTEMHAFCKKSLKDTSIFKYKESLYSEDFSYTAKDCELLMSSAVSLRNIIRKTQGTTLE